VAAGYVGACPPQRRRRPVAKAQEQHPDHVISHDDHRLGYLARLPGMVIGSQQLLRSDREQIAQGSTGWLSAAVGCGRDDDQVWRGALTG
jgi:hypothetical protein